MTPDATAPSGLPAAGQGVSPSLFFRTVNAYQQSAALRAAIELDVFSAIAAGQSTASELAVRCGAAERGVRILCDYLVLLGFLTKQGTRYGLTPDSAVFLDRRSRGYAGGIIEFLLTPHMMGAFDALTDSVRRGGAGAQQQTLGPDHPVWVRFARAMAPVMALPAEQLATLVTAGGGGGKLKVLDIAAGHGLFGIAMAKRNPGTHVTAVDWAPVLEVCEQNAWGAGLSDRYATIPGSAFDVDFGSGYDVVLLTNFLHHFDTAGCEALLKKVHAALADGGRAVALEFIPNEDRVTPPDSAGFALTMLATTPAGDAYTFNEYQAMFERAGFARTELHPLPPTMERVVIGYR